MSREAEIQLELEKLENQIKEKEKELREIKRERGVKLFAERIKELFEEVPELIRFEWEQYTPYFNDGSPCEFDVYPPSDFEVTKEFKDSLKEDVDYFSSYEDNYIYPLSKSENVKVRTLVNFKYELATSPDVMNSLFGDHAKVIVTKDSIEVIDIEKEHD